MWTYVRISLISSHWYKQAAGFYLPHLSFKLPLTTPPHWGKSVCLCWSADILNNWRCKSVLHHHESSPAWSIHVVIEGKEEPNRRSRGLLLLLFTGQCISDILQVKRENQSTENKSASRWITSVSFFSPRLFSPHHSPKFNYLYWLLDDTKLNRWAVLNYLPQTHTETHTHNILSNTHQVPLVSELGIIRFYVDVPLFPLFWHLLLCPSHLNRKCANTKVHIKKWAKQTTRWREQCLTIRRVQLLMASQRPCRASKSSNTLVQSSE